MTPKAATILIVDDEAKNRRLLELLLQHEGYGTVSAASGDAALALMEQCAPDLILLDAMMPVLDGYQLARILKAHPLSLNIPIIMISAHGDRTARLAGLNAGAEEFLTKPIDRDELWLRVRNLLRLKSDADLVRNASAILEASVQARTLDLQRFRSAMEATADSLTLVDRTTMRYVEVNAAACSLVGYSREEMLSLRPQDVLGVYDGQLEALFDAIIAGDAPSQLLQTTIHRKDGTGVCVEVSRQALKTGDGWTIVSVARDITDRNEAQAALQQLAHYDSLTKLPNRWLFHQSLLKAMEQADALEQQVVLLYLDLDNFKDINDILGHAVGDQLLCEVGERLLACLHVRDCVGRLGGDEFGIVLVTPRDPEIALVVAGKIHEALHAPFALQGHAVRTSASIGITIYPNDTKVADVLARYADMAMYEAKRSGRNTSRFFTAAMNERIGEKLKLVSALHEALLRNEFVLHYQPKVSLGTGRWMGVEALLRWQRPGHGLVPPDQFIPALEDSGLIVAVGKWIIATACAQLEDWARQGLDPLPIAVNVSAAQIALKHALPLQVRTPTAATHPRDESGLLEVVASSLATHNVGPGMLEVEITESVVMADAEHSIDILRRLRALGVKLSVDDFGTGYSSLAYLRRFPLETVKIDGSFVRDVTTNAEEASIVLAIIELAHRLKLEVVAECVETVEQMQFLQAHGCDQAQGYYFARPMPVAELEAVWRQTGGMANDAASNPANAHDSEVLETAWPGCKQLVGELLAGRRAPSLALIEHQLASGRSVVEVGQCLIQPALYCIGDKWRSGQVSVAQEHLATALALSVMAEAVSGIAGLPATGKKVLLACVEGNHHVVGLQMVGDAFGLAGWDVNYLGANVPIDALLTHVKLWSPDVIALSAALPQHVSDIKRAGRFLRDALGDRCPHILVGGRAVDASSFSTEALVPMPCFSDAAGAVRAGEQLCSIGTLPAAKPLNRMRGRARSTGVLNTR